MSQLNRYIIWRGVAGPRVESWIDARASSGKLIEDNEFFVVTLATEEEIRAVFAGYLGMDGQIIAPTGALVHSGIDISGEFLVGVDVPIDFAGFNGRRNVPPGPASFRRERAERLIAVSDIRAFAATGTRKVNVVIMDGGLDQEYLKTLGYSKPVVVLGGPLAKKAGKISRPSTRHANAVARSVLSVAPDVHLVDAPILPERIDNVGSYTWSALFTVLELLFKVIARPDESWVVVCAWGLPNRRFDRELGTYADSHKHPLSSLFKILVQNNVDVVFSAGNSGQFWPDPTSGHTDRGPFRSIFGSNGLSSVLTVGEVDSTARWIGESSQGPEPPDLRIGGAAPPRKPDVCAPSWFCETYDRHATLTGTSGACALVAGIVAAVRKARDAKTLSPAQLIDAIRNSANPLGFQRTGTRATPAEWRMGSGIIDCAELVASL